MAFTKATLPAGGYAMAAFAGGGRWLVFDSNNYDRIHVTSDWVTLTTTMKASIGLTGGLEGACYNGTSWFFVASSDGLWRSTDGSTGGAWVKTTPDFSGTGHISGGSAKHIHATATGRLIAFGVYGISVSDNSGATWTSVESSASASTLLRSGISEAGGDIFVWHDRADVFLRSNDNGDTWGSIFTPTLDGSISSVAKVPAGWIICTALGTDVPKVSADNGATWSDAAGFAADKYFLHGNGSQVAILQESYPDPVLSITDDLVTWDAFPTTGLTTDLVYSATPVVLDASSMVLVAGLYGSETGVYTAPIPVSALDSWLAIDSPLGSVALLGFSDFAAALSTTEWVDYYACDLVVGSTVIARMPMSSWQATLQTGRASYVQAVIPSAENYATTIQSNPTAEFVIYKGARSTTGEAIEQEMARAPVETLQLAKGFSKHTAVLSGYTNAFLSSTSTTAQTLQNVRQIFSGTAGYRVRSAIDWYLRPGMTANFDGGSFTVAYINYYVGSGDAYMDVGERAL